MATEKSTKDLNHHARADEDELNMHYPKRFLGSTNGKILWKDETGNIDWIQLPVFPPVIDVVDGTAPPPTENDGDVYVLDIALFTLDVDTIVFQSGNTIRYTFNASPDLSSIAVGDHLRIRSAGEEINNGTFKITDVNDGSDFIEVENPDRSDGTDDEASDSPAVGTTTDAAWDENGDGDWVEYNTENDVWEGVTLDVGTVFFNETEGELQIVTPTGFESASNRWIKISKTFADFSIAGLEKDIEVISLPAGHELVKHFIKHNEAFSGSGITGCETELGIVGELDKYMFEAFDVFQTVDDKVFGLGVVNVVENWGSATSIRGNMKSIGANLDQLSAGKIDYYVYIEKIKI